MPRMRFGNGHVFNLYCNDLAGRGIQSTTEAATLVENSYFFHPQAGSRPTVEENGGPTGIVKVVNSRIVNLPGVNVEFRQYGQSNFMFNAPFAAATPPYAYTLDAVEDVPGLITNYAGVGKIDFELWQMEQFTAQQLANPAFSGRDADPDADGLSNYEEFQAGTNPTNRASVLRINSIVRQDTNVMVSWSTAGGRTNRVEATRASSVTPISSNFLDISGPIAIPGSGDATTNYLDMGGGRDATARYYRVRLEP
jgi:hypothetical protein